MEIIESRSIVIISYSVWPKHDSLGWRPGPGKHGQKGENMPPLRRHPQKIPNPKRKKIFFQSQLDDLPNP